MEGSATPPSLILCGPQAQLPSSDDAKHLHQVLSSRGMTQRLSATVDNLPTIFQQLADKDNDLNRVPGVDALGYLQQWLESGQLPSPSEVLPNVVALPLTVILQIAQFLQYLDRIAVDSSYQSLLDSVQQHGVQGFCAGFLTAAAIAFSENDEELAKTAAVSLRLATCVGAYIDRNGLYANPPNPACAFSVRWKSEDHTKEKVISELKRFPKVSVDFKLSLCRFVPVR